MKSVLALDVATVTGYAFGPIGEPQLCDALRFGHRDACDEDVWFPAMCFLTDRLNVLQPDVVAIEAPINSLVAGGTNARTTQRLLGLQAVLRTVVRAKRPNLAQLINVQSARKFFIGHGNLPGEEAKRRVRAKCIELGWLTEEDATYDKADALCVYAKACADIDRAWAASFTDLGVRAAA